MATYCAVCGKELTKTAGPIGPVCLKKQSPNAPRKVHRIPKQVYINYLKKHDIFAEEELDEQNKIIEASKGASEEETCEGGESPGSD